MEAIVLSYHSLTGKEGRTSQKILSGKKRTYLQKNILPNRQI